MMGSGGPSTGTSAGRVIPQLSAEYVLRILNLRKIVCTVILALLPTVGFGISRGLARTKQIEVLSNQGVYIGTATLKYPGEDFIIEKLGYDRYAGFCPAVSLTMGRRNAVDAADGQLGEE